jgi:hypothetical protein
MPVVVTCDAQSGVLNKEQFGGLNEEWSVQLFHSYHPPVQLVRQLPALSQVGESWHQPSNWRLSRFWP